MRCRIPFTVCAEMQKLFIALRTFSRYCWYRRLVARGEGRFAAAHAGRHRLLHALLLGDELAGEDAAPPAGRGVQLGVQLLHRAGQAQ